MDEQVLIIIRLVFWILSALIVFLPVRWAILTYILIAHFDLSGSYLFASATEVGLENTVKVLCLPVVLLLRMGFRPIRSSGWSWASASWVALIIYSAVAILWSPFQLSALKMVSYLLSYLMLYLIFSYAWSNSYLTHRTLVAILWMSLLVAVLQTYVLGGQFPATEGRFTSFVSPQGFAAYLVSILAILMFSGKSGLWHSLNIMMVIFSILLTGSRYILFGAVILLVVGWLLRMVTSRSARLGAWIFCKGAVGTLVIASVFWFFVEYFPDSRVNELLQSNPYGGSTLQNVGTFVWRLGIYEETAREIGANDLVRLAFGSGTSSGADFMLRYNRRTRANTIDANRVLHNEFLRALYEWGLVGLTLLVAFVVLIFLQACQRAWKKKSYRALAVIGIIPAIVSSLLIENTLAGVSGPGGVGFVLVLAFGLAPLTAAQRENGGSRSCCLENGSVLGWAAPSGRVAT